MGHAWYILRVTDPVGLGAFWRVAPRGCGVRLASNEAIRRGRCWRFCVSLPRGASSRPFRLLAYHLAHGALGDWFRDTFVAAMSIPRSWIHEQTWVPDDWYPVPGAAFTPVI